MMMIEDLPVSKETGTPKKRGNVHDARATEEPLLSGMVCEFRIKEVIERKQEVPNFPNNNLVSVVTPNYENSSNSIDGVLASEYVSRRYECAPDLEYLGQQTKQ